MTTGVRFITRSTAKSAKVEQIDGVDHYIISMGVTSDSHPFFTGQKQFVDTEGRIDKFQKRFGSVRRAGKSRFKAYLTGSSAWRHSTGNHPAIFKTPFAFCGRGFLCPGVLFFVKLVVGIREFRSILFL